MAITYADVAQQMKEKKLAKSWSLIKTVNGNYYARFHDVAVGNPEIYKVLAWFEADKGTKRTFSLNPARRTATFTYYPVAGEDPDVDHARKLDHSSVFKRF
ncbi:hypothetical protein D3C76_403840 [compost metagenome]